MTQLSLDLARAHDNRQLFSNHFLDERLRGDAVWTEAAVEAEHVRRALRERLDAQRAALDGASERQTEERWIIPVLRELGWGFEVQPVSRRQGSTQFPDYALFASQAEADAAALAGLARRMTDLEAAMRRERAEFLAWLEGEIGCPVDVLANQTRVRIYDRHDADALLAVLEKNHPGRVRIDLAAPRSYGA